MRIVFVNLQDNAKMIKVLEKYIFKISVGKKHRYLLDGFLRRDIQVCNYISKGGRYKYRFLDIIDHILYPLRLFEARIILKKDGIPTKKIKTLYRLKDIHPDDMVILYSDGDRSQFSCMAKVVAFKVGCLLHTTCGSDSAEKLEKANIQCLYNEADLSKTGTMFHHYYKNLNVPIFVIPFVAEERFQCRKPFKERQNKAIAVGTITYRRDKEFLAEYGDPCLQPIRKMIRDAAPQLVNYYDSVMSDYSEGVTPKTVNKDDKFITKLRKIIWNKKHIGQQKSYFSFDMVDKFNQYKMAICGEEIIGVPGIGFVESMACGCAYIGCSRYDYAAYGMVEGEHYIGYDGSLEDLKNKIAYYQEHTEELERIARAGYQFAHEHFTGEAVTTKLLDMLQKEQGKYLQSRQKDSLSD